MTPMIASQTERDGYVATFRREHETTMRLLRAFPAEQVGLKPNDRLRDAGDLAWTMALNQMVVTPIMDQAELLPQEFPKRPATWQGILDGLESIHRDAVARLERGLTDTSINEPVRTVVGPGQEAPVRRGDVLWKMLYDGIHHRGQFSVYSRLAGAKVPSIYGPSADEPWF